MQNIKESLNNKGLLKKKNLLFLIIPAILLLVTLYFITSNTTNKKICKISKEIINLNDNLSKTLTDDKFDTSKSISLLSDNVANLNLLKSSLNEIEIKSQSDTDFKLNLSNSIDSTIDLYNHCILYLSNTDNINSDTLSKFISLKANCDENYLKVSNFYEDFTFSEDTTIFFSNVYTAFNDSLKIARNNKISSQQKSDFIITLSKFNKDLDFLTEDLTPAISNVRNEKGSFDKILEDIKKKEETLYRLNKDILNLSIPQGCSTYYSYLNDFLKNYQGYLQALKDSITYESTKTSSLKFQSEKDKKYKNSTQKYDDMKDYYKKYKDSLSN